MLRGNCSRGTQSLYVITCSPFCLPPSCLYSYLCSFVCLGGQFIDRNASLAAFWALAMQYTVIFCYCSENKFWLIDWTSAKWTRIQRQFTMTESVRSYISTLWAASRRRRVWWGSGKAGGSAVRRGRARSSWRPGRRGTWGVDHLSVRRCHSDPRSALRRTCPDHTRHTPRWRRNQTQNWPIPAF